MQASDRLWGFSSATFRNRWDAVLAALKVPEEVALTPGGLRGGGCVAESGDTGRIDTLMWLMRLLLEHYLQEVVARQLVAKLPQESRQIIVLAKDFDEPVLRTHAAVLGPI